MCGSFWSDDRLSRPEDPVTDKSRAALLRFGTFEPDLEQNSFSRTVVLVHLQPQPIQAALPADEPDRQTRDPRGDPGSAVKDDTFVDFEQGVNFAIIRRFVKRSAIRRAPCLHSNRAQAGYKFLVPVSAVSAGADQEPVGDPRLEPRQSALGQTSPSSGSPEERSNTRQKILVASAC